MRRLERIRRLSACGCVGDVFFHLDPLWADANIDVVGIDWPPLTGLATARFHADAAALARNIHDCASSARRIEAAGEN